MKKVSRVAVLVFNLAFLSACGFSPIYGARDKGESEVQESLNSIALANISGEHGQFLRNKLIDRLYFKGRPSNPQARLTINLSSYETSLGVKKDATTSRSQLNMAADYKLETLDGKTVLASGSVTSIASYSKLDAQYGTLTTQRDSYTRALIDASEQIVNRLSLYYAESAPTIKGSSGYLSSVQKL